MPLTRRERRILRDIEADLIKDDPEFVRRMSANELEGEVSPHRLVMIGLAVLGLCIMLPLLLSAFTSPAVCVPSTTGSPSGAASSAPPVPGDRPAPGERPGVSFDGTQPDRRAEQPPQRPPGDAAGQTKIESRRVVCR